MSQEMEIEDSQGKRKFRIIKAEGTSPSSSAKKRKLNPKERLVNAAKPKGKGTGKKRGSSIRVTLRRNLRQQRKKLRHTFFLYKKAYLIKKRRLDRDINSLQCTSAGRYIDKKSGAYMA